MAENEPPSALPGVLTPQSCDTGDRPPIPRRSTGGRMAPHLRVIYFVSSVHQVLALSSYLAPPRPGNGLHGARAPTHGRERAEKRGKTHLRFPCACAAAHTTNPPLPGHASNELLVRHAPNQGVSLPERGCVPRRAHLEYTIACMLIQHAVGTQVMDGCARACPPAGPAPFGAKDDDDLLLAGASKHTDKKEGNGRAPARGSCGGDRPPSLAGLAGPRPPGPPGPPGACFFSTLRIGLVKHCVAAPAKMRICLS